MPRDNKDLVAEDDAVVIGGSEVSVGVPGLLEIFNQPGEAFAVGTYARAGTFAEGFDDKAGKLPKAGVYAAAGVGHARAEWSVFDAEAKGPNASAGVEASVDPLGARAFAKAELASASASAGPVKASVGLAVVRGGADVSLGLPGLLEMIDTYDRPGKAFAAGTYAGAGTFAEAFHNKPGKRLPKAGVYAAAGVGHARAEWSVFDAEAKGPNASAGVGASVGSLGARAFAKAEVASASASAGPVKVTVGLAVDTGVSVSLTGIEAKLLGTGIAIGRKICFSVLGNGIECNL